MFQAIRPNVHFNFNSNTGTKKKKNFKIYLIKKLISHLNVQANKTKDEKPFGFNSWSDSKTLV